MSLPSIQSLGIPLDGSSSSQRAAAYGIYIAKRIKVPLAGLYAGKSQGHSPAEEPFLQAFRKDCRDAGLALELRELNDLSLETIRNATVDGEDRLLLLPRRESEDAPGGGYCPERSALSRIADSLMIVPPKFREIESMGLIYDGSPAADRALGLAVPLSREAVWPLTVLIFSADQERIADLIRQLEAFFEGPAGDPPIDWDTVALAGPEEETALRFIRDGSIELLVLPLPDSDRPPLRILRESPIALIVTL